MRTRKIEMAKAERQLLRMTASDSKDRIKIHVELLNEPYLSELCEALLKYILIGETTHFDSRVMSGLYNQALALLQEESGAEPHDAEEGVRDED